MAYTTTKVTAHLRCRSQQQCRSRLWTFSSVPCKGLFHQQHSSDKPEPELAMKWFRGKYNLSHKTECTLLLCSVTTAESCIIYINLCAYAYAGFHRAQCTQLVHQKIFCQMTPPLQLWKKWHTRMQGYKSIRLPVTLSGCLEAGTITRQLLLHTSAVYDGLRVRWNYVLCSLSLI